MGPSAYHARLAKDQLVEEREGVKVIFAGGSVFHLHVEGAEKRIAVRGAKAAWDRAEAERKKLKPEYEAKPFDEPSQPAEPVVTETEGAQAGEGPAAPADNGTEANTEDAAPKEPEAEAAIPPAEAEGEEQGGTEPEAQPNDDESDGGDEGGEGEGPVASLDDPVRHVSLEGGDYPITLADVRDVRALLGPLEGRLSEFIGNPAYRRLTERVRATDGCCAPIFFVSDRPGEEVVFFTGLETLGAAIHLGMERIAVVTVPTETAKVSQGPITAMLFAANAEAAMSDDEMAYRLNN